MKIFEFHLRIRKTNGNLRITLKNHENPWDLWIEFDNNKNQKNVRIIWEHQEKNKNSKSN